jgi:hypothetical protein
MTQPASPEEIITNDANPDSLDQCSRRGVILELPSIPDPVGTKPYDGPKPRLGTLRQIVRDPELADRIIAENSVTERNRQRAMRRLARGAFFWS